jgi:hypothetical protein
VSARSSPLGSGLYFIDVLACLLFCLTLALVGARFGQEQTVEVDLPRIDAVTPGGAALSGRRIAIREQEGELRIHLDGERVSFDELEAQLRAAPPASIVVRSEASTLARIVAIAHAAGVHDIELAYRTGTQQEGEQ